MPSMYIFLAIAVIQTENHLGQTEKSGSAIDQKRKECMKQEKWDATDSWHNVIFLTKELLFYFPQKIKWGLSTVWAPVKWVLISELYCVILQSSAEQTEPSSP